MMRSSVILFLALIYVGASALCVGGVLSHVCECGALPTCGHELVCGSDPCEVSFAPTDSRSAACTISGAGPAVARAANPLADDLAETGALQNRPDPGFLPDGLSFPPSDIPRLV